VPPAVEVNIPEAKKPFDFIWLGISVLALLVGVAGSYLIRKIIDNKRNADSVSPENSLKFTPHPDPGKVRIEAGQSLDPDFELRLRPVKDPGVQSVDPREGLAQQESEKP
jgi:hypothetical protein